MDKDYLGEFDFVDARYLWRVSVDRVEVLDLADIGFVNGKHSHWNGVYAYTVLTFDGRKVRLGTKEIAEQMHAFLQALLAAQDVTVDLQPDLALQALGDRAALPAPGAVGLYHVAFEVHDATMLLSRWDALLARGRVVGVDHGISWALYTNDPDGNGVEVYLDRRSDASHVSWRGHSLPLERSRVEEVAAAELKTQSHEHIPSGGF
jgi:catechol-2,3-dioxygenase